ncbi:hypothetical protein NE237_007929 [Protea cynaroides]|uniref:Uncharacterized protein n=1 Tax=Protea cynaroides TaxID=273540 RepID=A0A9Q0QWL2_9MAGN|nr:hypothetical protein NE237_007929 [Protea cynaroides]
MTSTCRLMSPKSPGHNAFEQVEGSNDESNAFEQVEGSNDESNAFEQVPDSNIQDSSIVSFEVEISNSVQDQQYGAKVSGSTIKADRDGHQVVDKTASIVLPPKNAAHARSTKWTRRRRKKNLMINFECLPLRGRYVLREHVMPWMEETVTQSHSQVLQTDPFYFEPVEKIGHYFQMEDGVVHVYASKDETRKFYPVSSSTEFFTDMHYILRVISLGNARSVCNHRLRFLEEIVNF